MKLTKIECIALKEQAIALGPCRIAEIILDIVDDAGIGTISPSSSGLKERHDTVTVLLTLAQNLLTNTVETYILTTPTDDRQCLRECVEDVVARGNDLAAFLKSVKKCKS